MFAPPEKASPSPKKGPGRAAEFVAGLGHRTEFCSAKNVADELQKRQREEEDNEDKGRSEWVDFGEAL